MKEKSEIEVAQLCPTLLDPMDCSLSGSSAHGIFQARVLSRLVINFLPRSKHLLISWLQSSSAVIFPLFAHLSGIHISSVQLLSHIQLFATP